VASKSIKSKSRTKSGSNKKSKISTKVIAAIIVGIVAIAGIVVVFNSFASGPPPYQYSFYTTCTADKKTTTVKSDLGSGNVTVGWDTKSACLKDSAEEQAYRLNRAVTNEQPPRYPTNFERYKEYVQKLAGDRTPPPDLVPQSFLDQFKDKTDAEFVTQVFKNVLYRTPGDNGASWAADMKKNGWSRRDAVFIISSSQEAKDKNVGRFTEFLRNRPEPVAIKANAQITQDYRLKLVKGKLEEIKILNYAILVNRNEINAATTYASAKPKQDELAKLMIKQGEITKQVSDLARDAAGLTLGSPDISDAAIKDVLGATNQYLASSWAATIEAGSRAEDLNLKEYYTKVQAQQIEASRNLTRNNVGTPGESTQYTVSGGGASSLTPEQVAFLVALNNPTPSTSKYDPRPPKRQAAPSEPQSGWSTLWRKITTRGELICTRNCDKRKNLPWWTNKSEQNKPKPVKPVKNCPYNINPRTGNCTR
jgi:hypothetical protein